MELQERPWEGLPAGVAAILRPRFGEIASDIVATVLASVPEYGDLGDPVVAEAVERVRVGVDYGLARFAEQTEQPHATTVEEAELYRAIGRATHDRGIGLTVMNAVYRIAARVASRWAEVIAAEADLPGAARHRLTESVFVYIDELTVLAAEGYAQAAAEAAGERQERRAYLLGLLLLPVPVDRAALRAAAERASWPMAATVAGVALGDEERPTELSGRIGPDALAGSSGGHPCLLVPDPDGPGRPALITTALNGHRAAIGPTVETGQAARSLNWARQTLQLAGNTAADTAGPTGPKRASDHLAELVLTSDSLLLQTLIDQRLAPLAGLADSAQERLCDTLLAWLQHGRSAPAAAAVLGTHPGTIRYRLAQLRELLGDALEDPTGRFELELALRGRQLLSSS